jgi:hypothetical protein
MACRMAVQNLWTCVSSASAHTAVVGLTVRHLHASLDRQRCVYASSLTATAPIVSLAHPAQTGNGEPSGTLSLGLLCCLEWGAPPALAGTGKRRHGSLAQCASAQCTRSPICWVYICEQSQLMHPSLPEAWMHPSLGSRLSNCVSRRSPSGAAAG